MVMSRNQDEGRSHSIKSDNSSFERMEEFKYLGTTLKDQNYIQEVIKSRLKSGNYLFVKYYSPLHVSSIKRSPSGGHSCIHAAHGIVLVLFGVGPFVFQFAIRNVKDQDI